MSYDLDLVVDCGGEYLARVAGCERHGVTWNLRPIFVRAFRHGDGINHLDGMRADRAARIAQNAIGRIESNRTEYQRLAPANGWGTLDGALECLRDIVRWGAMHPRAKLRVCS